MISVKLYHVAPNRILEIVQELKVRGWVQDTDFSFAYRPATYNNDSHEAVTPRHTEFMFHTEHMATFFTLKYA